MHIEEVQLKGDNMTLLETIKSDMITAMKEKDSLRLGVIRMAKGAIQLEEWIEFWTIVFNSGYSEDEIGSEVNFIL